MARTSQTPGRRSKEFSIDIESAQLEKLFVQLEREIGIKTLKEIVKSEAASILYRAAQLTGKASVAKIKAAANLAKYRGKKVTPQFQAILNKRKARLVEKLRRVGASKDGWLYIARKLRLKPGNANARRGIGKLLSTPPTVDGQPIRHRATGGRELSKGRGSYAIEVYYGNPVGRWTGARQAIARAIAGRKGFFRRNLREGVFKSAKTIAAKYPGIQITKR